MSAVAASTRVCASLAVCLSVTVAARAENAPAAKLGTKIDGIRFQQGTAKPLELYDLKGAKAIVITFLSFECPVSTSYARPLAELAKTYGSRGVAFIGVCPGAEVSPAELAKQVKEFAIPFPVYCDEKLAAADALSATATPEAFVLDAGFVLRYRGRIDDTYAARLKKNRTVTRYDLRQAIDEVLAGKSVSTPATQPVGCPIPKPDAKPAGGSVTFYRDVLPVLQNQCQTCHRPGAVGPFALMTYKQAVNWADDIKSYTQSRKMPPWKPTAGPAFRDERRLSDKELATLAAWVDGGTPAGDPADAPPPREYRNGWHLGTPDLILEVPGDFHVGATGEDLFRCFVLPTSLPEDRYVTAVQVRPGNSRIVHHVLAFVDAAGQARKLLEKQQARKPNPAAVDHGPGYSSVMGVGFRPSGGLSGWAPGYVPHDLPTGTGYLLPKGADVILQVHYHRDGRAEKDRSAIGLYFAKKPVSKRFWGLAIPGRFWYVPAGKDHYTVKGSMWVHQDCEIHSVMPHMHLLGKQIKVTMTPPDGPARTLVAINDWDYNWQETYFFRETIPVKNGTRFDIEAVYDNSAANRNNPFNPPRTVFFGEETTNEMCFGFVGATSDRPGRIRLRAQPPK